MKKKDLDIFNNLIDNSPVLSISDNDKIVIFSDFHLGNRTIIDDFYENSEMFFKIIENYYLKNDYKLILNGDIEELQKNKYQIVKKRWNDLYEIFSKFKSRGNLFKIIGNHDYNLINIYDEGINSNIYDSIILKYKENRILIFHGHQLSHYYTRMHNFTGFFLRFFAKPLGIKNIVRSIYNKKLLKTELKIYQCSKKNKIISIIGHTHRPLFESISENELIKIKIENLIRKYLKMKDEQTKSMIRKKIKHYKYQIKKNMEESDIIQNINATYNNNIIIPCIFNSGTVINKNGITGIEIENGKISLIMWIDIHKKNKYYKNELTNEQDLAISGKYIRKTIKKDSLDYIFTRIKLLS